MVTFSKDNWLNSNGLGWSTITFGQGLATLFTSAVGADNTDAALVHAQGAIFPITVPGVVTLFLWELIKSLRHIVFGIEIIIDFRHRGELPLIWQAAFLAPAVRTDDTNAAFITAENPVFPFNIYFTVLATIGHNGLFPAVNFIYK
jgi:hypothetical protein